MRPCGLYLQCAVIRKGSNSVAKRRFFLLFQALNTHALTWLRGPKCVASSSPPERIRASLETTGLARFFSFFFSATDVANGKPAPDLFLHAASRMGVQAADCIVVEDSAAGVTAATTAGMTAVGFVGGSHAGPQLGEELRSAGARTIVADLRHLKSAVVTLRGW